MIYLFKKTFLYANDTKIIGQFSERQELQFDINRAIKWSASNTLSFDFGQFRVLEFSFKNTYEPSENLFAKGLAIKNEKQIKDLGLIFTSSMTWKCHLDMIINKVFQKLNHLRRVIPCTT